MEMGQNSHITPAVPPELDLYKRSFPTAYVATVLGVSPQAVNKRASIRRWECAPERIQGGGKLWLFKSMDKEAQKNVEYAVLTEYHARVQPDPEQERDLAAMWEEFAIKPDSIKDRAFERHALLLDVLEIHETGATLKMSFDAVAFRHGKSAATLRNWYFGSGGKIGVRNIDPKDWLPYLADNHKGRVVRANCDEIAWEWFKKDYFRKEEPSFASCYRRLARAAEVHSWEIPSERTLRRRIFEAYTWHIIERLRTGKLHNPYPDQERRRDSFPVGHAVSGDALSFDYIKVFDEITGEVFSPRVWLFEDVHSGKIRAFDADKTENADMFRRATYKLSAYGCPKVMIIDNTTAASNKCMTGQFTNRRRFKNSPTEPVGLLKHLRIDVRYTNPDHDVASPGSKPIERAFGIGGLHSSMRELPELVGRGTMSKPISMAEFLTLLEQVVAEHNSRKGRRGGVCNGRSFDEVFEEGLKKAPPLNRISERLRGLLLCDQESCRVSTQCTVTLKAGKGYGKHRYYADFLAKHVREYVAVAFNPDNLSGPVTIFDLKGKYLGTADWMQSVAFNDKAKGREHGRLKGQYAKLTKQAAQKAARMTNLEYQQLNVSVSPSPMPIPERTVTQIGSFEAQQMSSRTPVSQESRDKYQENFIKNVAAMA